MTPLLKSRWTEVSVDFKGPFKIGEYLLVVDDFSRFPIVKIIHSLTSRVVIPALDEIFSLYGFPEVMKTDNGPPFNGEAISQWAKQCDFKHRKITLLWPQANGEVERFMRIINCYFILSTAVNAAQLDCGDWRQEIFSFLRHYRATPHSTTGKSPAELHLNRKIKTELPFLKKDPVIIYEALRRKDDRVKQHIKELADKRHHATPIDIQSGDKVLLRTPGQNIPYDPNPYDVTERKGTMVTIERGQQKLARNRSALKRILFSPNNEPSMPIELSNLSETPSLESSELRRSTRVRKEPTYLSDFEH